MTGRSVTILLVDDDKVDIMAIRRAFRELRIANPVIEAHNGLDALALLRGEDGVQPLSAPCLILLDLNMPMMGGLEFLETLRNDSELKRNIVFVMTTSAAEEDLIRAYNFNVAGYILKHKIGQTFIECVAMLELYWRVIEFPV